MWCLFCFIELAEISDITFAQTLEDETESDVKALKG